MTIREVETETGLPRSNIRFYEKEKLIKPVKNSENGYKDYTLDDVEHIKKIAYLRTLGVPVEEIRLVKSGELDLYTVIENQRSKIEEQMSKMSHSRKVCDQMLQSAHLSYEALEIEEYVADMNAYWEKNQGTLRFDSTGLLYRLGKSSIWWILFLLCLVVAFLSCPWLPNEIPVQWEDGFVTSQVDKFFIFAYPVACILVRTLLRPIFYLRLRSYFTAGERVTDYVVNSICFLILSVELFSILYIAEMVKYIEIVLAAEGIVFAGLLLGTIHRRNRSK